MHEHRRAVHSEGADDAPEVIALFIDAHKAPVLAVDLLTFQIFRLGVVACRDLRKIARYFILPSLSLALLNKLFERLQVAG